jgi:hypothetical protein
MNKTKNQTTREAAPGTDAARSLKPSGATTTSQRTARQARHARRRMVIQAFRSVTRLVKALPVGQYQRAKAELIGTLVASSRADNARKAQS